MERRTSLVAAAAAIAIAAAVYAQNPDREPRPVAITHVNVIDTAAGALVPDVTVTIRGGKIIAVGKIPPPAGFQVVDGRNKFVVPGLWDMHVHLSYARASALPMLAATGVLFVRDVGSDLSELDEWRGRIASDDIVGPAIVRAGPILNGQESNQYHLLIANAADARMAVRTLKKAGVDVLKTHRRTSRDAYFALVDEAKKAGLPVVGHVPMTVSPEEASNAGQQTIEHVETLFEGTFATAHNGQVTVANTAEWRASPEAASMLATFVRNGTVVDPTLIAQGYLARILGSANPDPRLRYLARSSRRLMDTTLGGIPAAQRAEMPPLIREREAVTLQMQRAGVTLVTGTDLSFLHPPGFSLHDELDMLVESGLTPAEAIRAATLNCAKLFPSLETGVIAPGKRADLVLLAANPLENIRNTTRIDAVVLRGRVLDRPSLDRLLERAVLLAQQM